MSLEYDITKWRPFIDSSRSLKAVLHNGNSFSSISIEHSVQMKETHNTMDHDWSVKILRLLDWS